MKENGVHSVHSKEGNQGKGCHKRQAHNMYGGHMCIFVKEIRGPHLQVGKIGAPCPQEGGGAGRGIRDSHKL